MVVPGIGCGYSIIRGNGSTVVLVASGGGVLLLLALAIQMLHLAVQLCWCFDLAGLGC